MKEKMICRGDLFYYDFGDNSGSVQSGERPVLVIQADDYNQNAPTIIVAAVTSVIKKRYLPSHIILGEEFGLKKPSMVLLEQIRTVNREDLREYICLQIRCAWLFPMSRMSADFWSPFIGWALCLPLKMRLPLMMPSV